MGPTRSLRLTWQTEASSLSVMPARVPFAYVVPVVAKSFDAEMADSVLTEKVLPHDLHFYLWRPCQTCPLQQKSADSYLRHLLGVPASSDPAHLLSDEGLELL
jgi:hypothetical protein